jgi:hypothetical protein
MRGPRNFDESQLKRVGVTLKDPDNRFLHCDVCGQGWQPMIKPGGKLRRLYWVCPNKCNRPEKEESR